MIYGTEDENGLDKAVRLVIMLIMVVFDPLAVLLLIAANMSMTKQSGRTIVKDGEVVGLTPEDVPVFTDPSDQWKTPEEFFTEAKEVAKKLDKDRVEIEKENLTEIKEETVPEEEDIIIDETSGETIPPLGRGKRGFPNRKSNKLEPKYDYDAEYAFKEKKNDLDGGKF